MPRLRSARKSAATTYRTRKSAALTVPATMRAAAIDKFGDAEEIDFREFPVPNPAAHEVLIRIDTAGVGSWDPYFRAGEIPTEREFPLVLGSDGAGIVAEVGSRVRRFRRGDRVYAYDFDNPKGGFYAEYTAVPAKHVGRVPLRLDLASAGAVASIGLTALQGVDDALEISPDESVIVHGANGNVGMLAVQFAKLRGARVLATASGTDGVRFVKRLGLDDTTDQVIDGTDDDISLSAREFAPDGIDAVLAFVGGASLVACIDALKRGGRVAYPNGVEPEPRKRRQVRIRPYDAEASPEKFDELSEAIVAADLEIPIAKTFPLARAADAHRMVERGHVLGRVVLRAVASRA